MSESDVQDTSVGPSEGNDSGSSSHSSTSGGILRGVSRSALSLFNIIRSATLGSVPRARIPLHSLGQTADQLGQIWEIRMHVKRSRTIQLEQQSRFRSRVSQLLHTAYITLPEMLKSTLLGAVLFTIYDDVTIRIPTFVSGTSQEFVAIASGFIGGLLHGCLYFSWDRIQHTIHLWSQRQLSSSSAHIKNIPVPSSSSLTGTMLSHSLSHAALFGTFVGLRKVFIHFSDSSLQQYQSVKSSAAVQSELLTASDVTDDKDNSPLNFPLKAVFAIGAAGAVAGAVAEVVGHYTEGMESRGVRKGILAMRIRPLPNARLLLPSLIPRALGFLAYEFAS